MVPDEKADTVDQLRKAFKGADGLWLATDFDREGEAIAWHVAESIGADPRDGEPGDVHRDHARTPCSEAFEQPATDRLRPGGRAAGPPHPRPAGGLRAVAAAAEGPEALDLSAGRVQSVALRLIVDREREIEAFVPVEYWSVDARLVARTRRRAAFLARLIQVGDEKLAASPDKKGLVLSTQEEAEAPRRPAARRGLPRRRRSARARSSGPRRRRSPPRTLQQEAARKLGFSARRTMQVAQRLYEGVDVPGEGQVGLITYMRTDSVNIADQALAELADVVQRAVRPRVRAGRAPPVQARSSAGRRRRTRRSARPAPPATPTGCERVLDRDQARLYRLIWQRTVASQMAEARFDQVSVDIAATPTEPAAPTYLLRATGQTLKFDGFRRVYFEGRDDAAGRGRRGACSRRSPPSRPSGCSSCSPSSTSRSRRRASPRRAW